MLLSLMAWPILPAQAQPPADPVGSLELRFERAALVVTGATPSSEVAVFGVAREPKGYFQTVSRHRELVFADSFGEARYELEGGTPLKSVWAVADLSSGDYAVAASPGFPLEEIDFPGQGFAAGAPGLVNLLRHRFSWVDMLLVRPEEGAWGLVAWDTGPGDRDGRDDDRTTTSLVDLEPLGASPVAPERYGRGDVVIVINSRDLRYYATRLVGAPSAGGAR